jgi:glucose/arabinose dehydrogenase
MRTTPLIALVVGVAVLVGGYFTYDYVKEKPPTFLINWLTKTEPPPPLPAGPLAPLEVPQGFVATIYSREVPGARVMIRDPKGTMLVSLTKEGRVVALPDLNADQQADETVSVLDGLSQPHGLAVVCPDTGNASADQDACTLYVAETGALKAYAYDADTFSARLIETVTTFPVGSGHFTRTLLVHPDGEHLLASVGSSCNVCEEEDNRRATVLSINLATKEVTTVASGLRNTVFMALHPVTGELWGTDNGRDGIGDDIPPDELNIIKEGQHYGWPYCYGQRVYDADFGEESPEFCGTTTASHIDLPAHSAALGLAFVPEEGWPEDMWHDALVAFHGSWNRSLPTGYKVVRLNLSPQGEPQGDPVDFVTGFLAPGAVEDDAIGRPVGLLVEPGGVVYVSDDRAGAVYRVARQ